LVGSNVCLYWRVGVALISESPKVGKAIRRSCEPALHDHDVDAKVSFRSLLPAVISESVSMVKIDEIHRRFGSVSRQCTRVVNPGIKLKW